MKRTSRLRNALMVPAAALLTGCLTLPAASAAVIQWANTGTAWATGSDWVGGVPPANDLTTDIALFNSTTFTFQPNYATRLVSGIRVGDGSTVTGPLILSGVSLSLGLNGFSIMANAGTVNLNNAVLLGANQSWSNNSGSLFTVAATVSNIGNTTPFVLTLDGSGAGATTFNGVISNGGTTGTTGLLINTTGGGSTLLGAANTFTGGIALNGGNLVATLNAGALGAAANVTTFGGGTLELRNDTALTFTGSLNAASVDTTIAINRVTSGNGLVFGVGATTLGAHTYSISAGANVLTNTAYGLTLGTTTFTGGNPTFTPTNNGTGIGTITVGAVTDNGFTAIIKGNGNFAQAGVMSGAGGLTTDASYTGSAILNQVNTFTGGVTINSGVVRAGTSASALGQGVSTLTLSGGELQLFTGGLTYGRNTTVTANSQVTSDVAGAGGGTETLGTLSIGAQRLTVAAGTTVTGGAQSVVFGATTLTGSPTFNVVNSLVAGTTNLTLGALNDGGTAMTITKTGTGTLTLGTAAASVTAGTQLSITGGTIAATLAGSLGAGPIAISVMPTAGTGLFSTTVAQAVSGISLGGSAGTTANVTGAGTLTLSGNVSYDATNNPNGASITTPLALGTAQRTFTVGDSTAAANDLTLGGVLTNGVGGSVLKTGAGTMLLSANSPAYTGGFQVNQGLLVGSSSNTAVFGTAASLITLNAGNLELRNDATVTYLATLNDAIGATITVNRLTSAATAVTLGLGATTFGSNFGVVSGANLPAGTAYGLTLGASTLTANPTFDVANNGTGIGTLTIGAINDGGTARTITKVNSGTLQLVGAGNTAAGTAFVVNAGILGQSAGNALGAIANLPTLTIAPVTGAGTAAYNLTNTQTVGSLTLGGASGTAANVTGTSTLTLGGGLVYDATNNPLGSTISANLSTGAAQRIFNVGDSTAAADDLTISGNLTNATNNVGLLKSGNGVLVLSGISSAYSGGIIDTAGTVVGSTNAAALGVTVSSTVASTVVLQGGNLELRSDTGTTFLAPITATTNNASIAVNRVTPGAIATSVGIGAVSLGNETLSISAGSNITAGTAYTLNLGALSLVGAGRFNIANNGAGIGTLSTSTISEGILSLVLDGSGNFAQTGVFTSSSGGLTLAPTFTGTATLNQANTFGGQVTVNGGTAILGGTSTSSGVLINNAGIITLGSATGLGGTSANVVFGASSTGKLQLNGYSPTIGTFAAGTPLGAPIVENASATAATLNVGNGDFSTFGGVLRDGTGGGALSLTKSGTGTLVLTGTNLYTGALNLTGGFLNTASAGINAGSTTNGINFNGGVLQAAAAGITTGKTVAFTGAGTFDTGTAASIFSGVVSGAGTFTLAGTTGTLALTTTNTFTGAYALNGGTLIANSSSLNGSSTTNGITFNGGALQASGGGLSTGKAIALTGPGTFDANTGTSTFSGVVSGAGTFTVAGTTGSLALTNTNTFTGAYNLAGGTLSATTASFNGSSAANGITFNGGTLQAGSGGITTGKAVTLSTTGTFDTNGNNSTLSGVVTGTGALTKTGTGILTLSGNSNFSGGLTVNNGTVQAGGAAATPLGTGTVTFGAAAATLDLNGQTITTGLLAGTVGNGIVTNNASGTGTATLTLNGTGTQTYGGQINDGATAKVALTKSGVGTQVLNGSVVNTYTGATTFAGGTLQLNFANRSTPTNLLSATTALTAGGGTFSLLGKSGVNSSQTVASLNVSAGQSVIAINPNGATDTLTISSGTINRTAGAGINFDTSAGTPATAIIAWNAAPLTNSLIGDGFTVTDNAGTGFATVAGGNVVRYTGATPLSTSNSTSSTTTTNFSTTPTDPGYTGGTLTLANAAHAANSLAIASGSGGTLNLGAQSLTLTTGALLMTGTGNYTITTGSLASSAADLAVSQFGTGTLTINSVISSNLTKLDAGTLVVTGINTFTNVNVAAGVLRATTTASSLGAGTVTLNGGELQLANATGLSYNRNTNVLINSQITSDVLTAGSAGVTHTLGTLGIGNQTLTVAGGSNVSSGTAGLTFGVTTLGGNSIFNVVNPVNGGGTTLTFNGAITGSPATSTFTKTGNGTAVFAGTNNANTYTGLTTISGGELDLNKTAATNAIAGDVTVGNGTLKNLQANEIADTSNVSVTAGGTFNLNSLNETVNTVTLTGSAGSTATLALGAGTTGALVLNGATPTLTFGANTMLTDSGTTAAPVSINPATATPITLNFNGGTVSAGQVSLLNGLSTSATFNITKTLGGNGSVFVVGGVTKAGQALNLNLNQTGSIDFGATLLAYSNTSGGTPAALTVNIANTASGLSGGIASVALLANATNPVNTVPTNLYNNALNSLTLAAGNQGFNLSGGILDVRSSAIPSSGFNNAGYGAVNTNGVPLTISGGTLLGNFLGTTGGVATTTGAITLTAGNLGLRNTGLTTVASVANFTVIASGGGNDGRTILMPHGGTGTLTLSNAVAGNKINIGTQVDGGTWDQGTINAAGNYLIYAESSGNSPFPSTFASYTVASNSGLNGLVLGANDIPALLTLGSNSSFYVGSTTSFNSVTYNVGTAGNGNNVVVPASGNFGFGLNNTQAVTTDTINLNRDRGNDTVSLLANGASALNTININTDQTGSGTLFVSTKILNLPAGVTFGGTGSILTDTTPGNNQSELPLSNFAGNIGGTSSVPIVFNIFGTINGVNTINLNQDVNNGSTFALGATGVVGGTQTWTEAQNSGNIFNVAIFTNDSQTPANFTNNSVTLNVRGTSGTLEASTNTSAPSTSSNFKFNSISFISGVTAPAGGYKLLNNVQNDGGTDSEALYAGSFSFGGGIGDGSNGRYPLNLNGQDLYVDRFSQVTGLNGRGLTLQNDALNSVSEIRAVGTTGDNLNAGGFVVLNGATIQVTGGNYNDLVYTRFTGSIPADNAAAPNGGLSTAPNTKATYLFDQTTGDTGTGQTFLGSGANSGTNTTSNFKVSDGTFRVVGGNFSASAYVLNPVNANGLIDTTNGTTDTTINDVIFRSTTASDINSARI